MTFLRARHTPATSGFWAALAKDHRGAPAALQELAQGDTSVVCDPAEAAAALTWARRHSTWLDEPAPVDRHLVATVWRYMGSRIALHRPSATRRSKHVAGVRASAATQLDDRA